MFRIAITGGIGSGKSTICKVLEDYGYFVFYSDKEAKDVANNNPQVKENILRAFGEESYVEGFYNKTYIFNRILGNLKEIEKLNKCFESFIIDKYLEVSKDYTISFFESALIFEHGLQKHFDCIIGVRCPEHIVRERLKVRNGYTDLEISKILEVQLNPTMKMNRCHAVLESGNLLELQNYLKYFENLKNHLEM